LTIDLHKNSSFMQLQEVPVGYSIDSAFTRIPFNLAALMRFLDMLDHAACCGQWQAFPLELQNLSPMRMLQSEEDIAIDPYIKWTEISTGGCLEEMTSNVALRQAVPRIDQICQDIKSKIVQLRGISTVNQKLVQMGLEENELAGIVGYSHDLMLPNNEKSGNLYYECNNALRVKGIEERKAMIRTWGGYMHWTMKGLLKFPSSEGWVVRGVPGKSRLVTQYTNGLRVQWKAFSSASKNVGAAHAFFDDEDDGVIFRIKVKTGKSISEVSFFPSEDEVLLLPGKQYIVKSEPYQQNGLTFIDMEEVEGVGLSF